MSWYNPVDWAKGTASAAVESYHIARGMASSTYVRPENTNSIESNIKNGDFAAKGEKITVEHVRKFGEAEQQAFKNAETAMKTTATVGAGIATGGVGGVVVALSVDQGVKIGDQAGVIDARADGTRSGGAIAKSVTGNGQNITGGDVASDAISVATAVAGPALKAAAPALKSAGGAIAGKAGDLATKVFGGNAVETAKIVASKTVDVATKKIDAAKEVATNSAGKVIGDKVAGKIVQAGSDRLVKEAKSAAKDAIRDPLKEAAREGITRLVDGASGANIAKESTKAAVAAVGTVAVAEQLKPADQQADRMKELAKKANVDLGGAKVTLKESTPEGTLATSLNNGEKVNAALAQVQTTPSGGRGAA